jgi:hypothetical protein
MTMVKGVWVMKRFFILFLLFIFLLAAFHGCGGGNFGSDSAGCGSVRVSVSYPQDMRSSTDLSQSSRSSELTVAYYLIDVYNASDVLTEITAPNVVANLSPIIKTTRINYPEATATIKGIPPGKRSFLIQGFDSSNNLIYFGSFNLDVLVGVNRPGKVTVGKWETLPSSGTVKGTVTDKKTGNPIFGVIVTIGGNAVAMTASDGSYTIEGVLPGNQSIIAKADGYLTCCDIVRVSAKQTVNKDFQLQLGVAIRPDGSCEPKIIEIPLGSQIFYENQSKSRSYSIVSENLFTFSHISDTSGYIGKRIFVPEDFIVKNLPAVLDPVLPDSPAKYHNNSYVFNICGEYEYKPGTNLGAPGKVIVKELKPDDPRAKDQAAVVLSQDYSFNFGGSANEQSEGMIQTSDGGYVLCGRTWSSDVEGLNTPLVGLTDALIVKLDSEGNQEAAIQIGGKRTDSSGATSSAVMAREVFDSNGNPAGYIIGGNTDAKFEADGTTEIPGYLGNRNHMWLIKLDTDFEIEWQKLYGHASLVNTLFDLIICSDDKNFIITGTQSTNMLTIKIGSSGADEKNILWSLIISGAGTDVANKIVEVSSLNYVIVGETTSNTGHFAGLNNGSNDIAIAKIRQMSSTNVVLDWTTTLGGSSNDMGRDIILTKDGQLMVLGNSYSTDAPWGNKSNGFYHDVVVIKLYSYDNFATVPDVVWAKNFGGTDGNDRAASIIEHPDGGYVFLACVLSSNGDIIRPAYIGTGWSFWVVRVHENDGNIIWQSCLGGSGSDFAAAVNRTTGRIIYTGPGKYVISGYSDSNNGDLYAKNKGGRDFWVCFTNVIMTNIPNPLKK